MDVTPPPLPPFWSLVEAHGAELLAHVRRIVGDANAEDVLQDALLRALRAYPRLRHAEHLRAWLYRVSTTTAIDHHRARRREVLTDDPPSPVVAPEHYDDTFESLITTLPETAQDALLRALRAYSRLRHADHLRAWLYRVTTTTALDHHRARRREVLTDEPPAVAAEPEHYDDSFETIIARLPDGAQAALRLRFVEDLDYDGIASRLGISAVAARQRVSTAVRTLRTQEIPA